MQTVTEISSWRNIKMKTLRNNMLTDELAETLKEFEGGFLLDNIDTNPGTVRSVVELQQVLDTLLTKWEAREIGICSVRHRLYNECFKEVIRQIKVNCRERGEILSRIHKEVETTIESYQQHYHSMATHSARKNVILTHYTISESDHLISIRTETENLKTELEKWQLLMKQTQVETMESFDADEKLHELQMNEMNKTIEALIERIQDHLCLAEQTIQKKEQ